MIKSLHSFLSQMFAQKSDEPEARERGLKLVAAALMMEVARADFHEDVVENERIFELLKQTFSLSPEETELLMEQAGEEVDESVSLYEFTRLINDRLREQEKRLVIRLMWQVAYADSSLHRYEEHVIRKVAELIYLPTAELLRLRHEVEEESRANQ
ncbi:MAG: TerB family tellurite resistance protein [Gammaproteobacteria bacterium]|nr:TerB family tellurite resistance protein [Gammaproteobacteria bacterium]